MGNLQLYLPVTSLVNQAILLEAGLRVGVAATATEIDAKCAVGCVCVPVIAETYGACMG